MTEQEIAAGGETGPEEKQDQGAPPFLSSVRQRMVRSAMGRLRRSPVGPDLRVSGGIRVPGVHAKMKAIADVELSTNQSTSGKEEKRSREGSPGNR